MHNLKNLKCLLLDNLTVKSYNNKKGVLIQTVQVGQFKAEFSSMRDQVQNGGEKFIIEYGKQHKKVAILVPLEEEKKQRVFGQLKGKVDIPDNFDDEDEEINEMFYGSFDEDTD